MMIGGIKQITLTNNAANEDMEHTTMEASIMPTD